MCRFRLRQWFTSGRRQQSPLEDLPAAGERRFFTELNGSNEGHFLEALAHGVAQQILALLQNFGDGGFEESFQTAFFDGSHKVKLRIQKRQVKCGREGR